MILFYVICSQTNLIGWLQNHLLPCPFKALTGFDCPGCGFQRSLVALIQGDLAKSWLLYPPTIPLLILFISAGIFVKFPIRHQRSIQKAMIIAVGNFVLICYAYKMLN